MTRKNPKTDIVYAYTDEQRKTLFEVVRGPGKKFRQRRPFEGGYAWGLTEGWYTRMVDGDWIKLRNPRATKDRSDAQELPAVKKVLYRLPELRKAVADQETVFVVEGEKDADALVEFGLVSTTNPGGAGKWHHSYTKELEGAHVVICSDNDEAGRKHCEKVATALQDKVEDLRILHLPDLPEKGDVSDWVECRRQDNKKPDEILQELKRLVAEATPWSPRPSVREEQDLPYRKTKHGLVWLKPLKDGPVRVRLTNFLAEIVSEQIYDDGDECQRFFEIEARVNGRHHRFSIRAAEFGSLRWALKELGSSAVVYPGWGTQDHTRAAIQLLSDEHPQVRVFTHTGWRKLDDGWCYLHADGAIGPNGPLSSVRVRLSSALAEYRLPDPVDGADLERAVRASLQMLDLVPDEISIPLHAAVWRAAEAPCDMSVHCSGQTGEGKTELAALAQQHFGAGMDARHLPGNWSSTANFNETLAFHAKDALLVVDDFAPEGTQYDIQRQHKEAARLLRGQGNQSGRGRLRSDGAMRLSRPPRGLILSTGEDIPKAHSIRARVLILEIPKGALNWEMLSECQRSAEEGLYAQALSSFVQWLAPRYSKIEDTRKNRVAELRPEVSPGGQDQHRRTASIIAELAYGFEQFLAFAQNVGGLSKVEAHALKERAWAALRQVAGAQAVELRAADPANRFIELLRSALTSGRAHLVSKDGGRPQGAGKWGWTHRTAGSVAHSTPDWIPRGDQVGWEDGGNVYLDPTAAFQAAQRSASGNEISVQSTTLWKRLREKGLLASTDQQRGRNTIRKSLQGSRRIVLHLRAKDLMPPNSPAQSSQPSQGSRSGVASHQPTAPTGKPSQNDQPAESGGIGSSEMPGPIGPVGPTNDPEGSQNARIPSAANINYEAIRREFAPMTMRGVGSGGHHDKDDHDKDDHGKDVAKISDVPSAGST